MGSINAYRSAKGTFNAFLFSAVQNLKSIQRACREIKSSWFNRWVVSKKHDYRLVVVLTHCGYHQSSATDLKSSKCLTVLKNAGTKF